MEELQLSQKVLWHVVVISLHWTAFLFISPYSPRSIFSTAHNLEILLAHTVSPVSFHLSLLRVFQILWIWDVFIPLVHLHICLNFWNFIFYFFCFVHTHRSCDIHTWVWVIHLLGANKVFTEFWLLWLLFYAERGLWGYFLVWFSFLFHSLFQGITAQVLVKKARQKRVLLPVQQELWLSWLFSLFFCFQHGKGAHLYILMCGVLCWCIVDRE